MKTLLFTLLALSPVLIVAQILDEKMLIKVHSLNTVNAMNAIANPYPGSLVYVDSEQTLYYRTNNQWLRINDGWSIDGNSISNSTAELGTNNNQDLKIKTNNQQIMVVKKDGKVGINTNNPTGIFEVNSLERLSDIVPKMTTNNQHFIYLTASPSANSGANDIFTLFDNNNFSYWFTTSTSTSDSNPNAWVAVDIGLPEAVKEYTIRAGDNYNRTPRQYQLQGSHDANNWVNLEAINTLATNNWQSQPLKTQTVNNTVNYKHYRIVFHASFEAYSTGLTHFANYNIAEIQLKADVPELLVTDKGVGINVFNPISSLHINGDILANSYNTPDYVFENYYKKKGKLRQPNYQFKTLEENIEYVKKEKHLPNIPSKEEVRKRGGNLINRNVELQLEKIEELYLHLFELEEYLQELEHKYQSIKKD